MVLLLLQLQQHLCCASLTRVMLRSSSRTICSLPTTAVSVPSSSKVLTHVDPHVLLGMSEQDLQQLAIDFGQQSYRGKQLHHLLYKTKAKEIQDFSHLPQAFRNDLQEAGYKVGRSPIHQVVTAADGTIKALIKLEDNRLTETVGIPVEDSKGSSRLTACVSSQVSDFYKLPSSELNPTKAAMDESSHMFENRGGQLLGQIRHGSCRPRAILFKVLADTMGLESRLMVVRVLLCSLSLSLSLSLW
ncbi:hypothetical protein IFM89_000465 [Coptis chinensis]|uniref:EDR1/CTR1/ARMC3-like peptidase-like domain-containing protein n=1 Tax=Coptis chinensis TaxID=261450 RepID=A0A835LDU0_9MAGN|nr:hypothetical protein IFM89_000465 [Coptis chinensis]